MQHPACENTGTNPGFIDESCLSCYAEHMSPDDIRQQIELKVVELIKNKLADGTMTEERSQALAQHVLNLIKPGMSFEELYRAVPKLDDLFPELSGVVLPIVREYEEHVVRQAEDGVRQLIRQGHYDAAHKLAKNVISQNVKLVWQAEAKATPTQ